MDPGAGRNGMRFCRLPNDRGGEIRRAGPRAKANMTGDRAGMVVANVGGYGFVDWGTLWGGDHRDVGGYLEREPVLRGGYQPAGREPFCNLLAFWKRPRSRRLMLTINEPARIVVGFSEYPQRPEHAAAIHQCWRCRSDQRAGGSDRTRARLESGAVGAYKRCRCKATSCY